MTDHLCRIVWVPAYQVHQIVCTNCGETIVEDIADIGLFTWDGDCQPGETLNVSVSETVSLEDIFGDL